MTLAPTLLVPPDVLASGGTASSAGGGAVRTADVVVVGAGQAGLSVAYHLQRLGLRPATGTTGGTIGGPAGGPAVAAGHGPAGARTFVVLDAEDGPGGAWRHRWPSLLMATVNRVHDLPGRTQPVVDPSTPSRVAVPDYYAGYEAELALPVLRPVTVRRVARVDDDPHGLLRLDTVRGGAPETWLAGVVVNATGTWTKPFWPRYPGQETFRGRQLHTAQYERADDFAGQHVVVVGGGISAVQLLEEISHVASTTWVTRREPVWRTDEFTPEAGHDAVARVEERVRAGLPPASVVSVTGLAWNPRLRAAAARGVLDRRPMFSEITPTGVRWADGTEQRADAILWATGFRAALDHLAPLHLRAPGGGIAMDGTQVVGEPRVQLVGYGPSASTIGANRAGRDAARAALRHLDARQES